MTNTTDLKARLRACRLEYSEGTPGGLIEPINPDGPEAADELDAKDRTIAGLEAALKECVTVMGETLDKDFGFWSSPAQDDRRSRFYPAWKNASAVLKGQTP